MWDVSEDAAKPEQIVEGFFVDSRAEHLRQHDRASHADAEIHGQLMGYHQGEIRPTLRHFISIQARSRDRE